MSDQVVRYETEAQYLEYTNHRAYLATGRVMLFPNPDTDTDAYWEAYYKEKGKHPDIVIQTWTLLDKEYFVKGALERQEVHYLTLKYDNIDEARASRTKVSEEERPDPGFPVSAEFTKLEEAERVRSLLQEGEPGYYYAIKHRTGVCIIDYTTSVALHGR